MSFLTSTAPTVVVDGYDDGDLSEYQSNRTNIGTTQTNTVFSGTHAYKAGGQAVTSEYVSTSGLQTYPAAGQTWRAKARYSGDTRDFVLGWCVGTLNDMFDDAYSARIEPGRNGGQFRLFKRVGGSTTQLGSTVGTSPNANEWMTVTVEHTNGGDITMTVDAADGTNLATISATDTTFTSGGIGIFGNHEDTSADIFVDEWVLL